MLSDIKILAITPFPPLLSGSSVIAYNLLSQFSPSIFSLVTISSSVQTGLEKPKEFDIRYALQIPRIPSRFVRHWIQWQLPKAVRLVLKWVEQIRPEVILAIYPDYEYLYIAREVAQITGLPLIVYLHDTIAESLSHTYLADNAQRLQDQIFSEAVRILVMSEGMAELYEHKYRLKTYPLVHSYPDLIPNDLQDIPNVPIYANMFWGGNVYNINSRGVKRASDAAAALKMSFFLATRTSEKSLSHLGIAGPHIQTGFYPIRSDYLKIVQQQAVLLLALNWEDESSIHGEELSTIFPTKTPEFLAAGRPILVHCPEHYFLARFFRERNCGLVVSERSPHRLEEALQSLQSKNNEVRSMQAAALQTAQIFSATHVKQTFEQHLRVVLKYDIN